MRAPGQGGAHLAIHAYLARCMLLFGVISGSGCEERGSEPRSPGGQEPSPNASILPAPLASGLELGRGTARDVAHGSTLDAGRSAWDAGAAVDPEEPRPLREDRPLKSDLGLRDTSGLTLQGRFLWLDLPPFARLPETNPEAIQRLRDAGGFDVSIDLGAGRMRFALTSRMFLLPRDTELRAREDLYGHALVWPDHHAYGLLPPGTLRALLAEGRADLAPLALAEPQDRGKGNLFGALTERVELATSIGKLELEQGRFPISGSNGGLLCRLLVELIAAEPSTRACSADWVPLRAEYSWPSGTRFGFEVTKVARRVEFDTHDLMVPPPGALFRIGELPPPPIRLLASEAELAEFRFRSLPRTERAPVATPKAGLLVVNRGDSPRGLLLDGALVAWVAPDSEQLLMGVRPGKYNVFSRDFLAEESSAVRTLELPARWILGEEVERPK